MFYVHLAVHSFKDDTDSLELLYCKTINISGLFKLADLAELKKKRQIQ